MCSHYVTRRVAGILMMASCFCLMGKYFLFLFILLEINKLMLVPVYLMSERSTRVHGEYKIIMYTVNSIGRIGRI